jgi:hypothetical protein
MPEQYTQHLAEPCLQCGRRRQYDRPYLAQRSKFCSRACHMAYRNHEDMIGKVRGTQGERQWLAKLTEADVRAIRLTYASGSVAINQIAREHGVGRSTIQAIVHRRTWKHVA